MKKLSIGAVLGVALIAATQGARSLINQGETPSPSVARERPLKPERLRPEALEANPPAATPSAHAMLLAGDAAESDSQIAASGGKPRLLALPEGISPAQVLMSLLGVVALLLGTLYLVARFMQKSRLAPGQARSLQLVDALSLGNKRHVYVIAFQDRNLILGCGGDEVQLLAEYGSDEFANAGVVEDASRSADQQATAATPEPVGSPAIRKGNVISTPRLDRGVEGMTPGVIVELSAAARAHQERPSATGASAGPSPSGTGPRSTQRGAHRVPAAFRHLLEQSVASAENAES